jgi:hypothetical protein
MAAVCRRVFERSIWMLVRAAMILSVVRNPILERRQRLRIGLSALSKVT